jgi:hypothetical protein
MEALTGDGGNLVLRSAIDGEEVKVNLWAFYNASPKDLKAFLPVDFSEGEEFLPKKPFAEEKARNFLHGRPELWCYDAYSPYITSGISVAPPKAKVLIEKQGCEKKTADISKAARVMASAFGGWGVAIPLAAFVQ